MFKVLQLRDQGERKSQEAVRDRDSLKHLRINFSRLLCRCEAGLEGQDYDDEKHQSIQQYIRVLKDQLKTLSETSSTSEFDSRVLYVEDSFRKRDWELSRKKTPESTQGLEESDIRLVSPLTSSFVGLGESKAILQPELKTGSPPSRKPVDAHDTALGDKATLSDSTRVMPSPPTQIAIDSDEGLRRRHHPLPQTASPSTDFSSSISASLASSSASSSGSHQPGARALLFDLNQQADTSSSVPSSRMPANDARGKTGADLDAQEQQSRDSAVAEMSDLTESLKERVKQIFGSLQRDAEVVDKASELMDMNVPRVREETSRLKLYLSQTSSETLWSYALILFVFLSFMGMWLFMKIFPKPR